MLLPSSSLQPGRVHVVWGGGLSWQLETTTTSAFFTEVLFPYEDVLRLTFIGIFLVLALCSCTVWRRVGGVGGGAENLMVVVGSLVGRLALVLILAEAAVFLTINSRSAVTGDDDNPSRRHRGRGVHVAGSRPPLHRLHRRRMVRAKVLVPDRP